MTTKEEYENSIIFGHREAPKQGDFLAEREKIAALKRDQEFFGVLGREILETLGGDGLDYDRLFLTLLRENIDRLYLPETRGFDCFDEHKVKAMLNKLERAGYIRRIDGRWHATGGGEPWDPAAQIAVVDRGDDG